MELETRHVHPRHLRLLPRLAPPASCATARSWRRRRRSASRARSTTTVSRARGRVLPARSRASTPDELDYVGFYDKPLLKFERLLETLPRLRAERAALVPDGDAAVAEGEALHARQIRRELDGAIEGRFSSPSITSRTRPARSSRRRSTRRRSSRSTASASGPRRRIGVRAWATRSSCSQSSHFPHSLGLLYSAFTYFTRLQGQLRRVQADGPRALRRAALRRR